MKDEAFELGLQWANLYDSGSPTRQVITNMMETYFLVNVVHNDFKDPDAIFRPFLLDEAPVGVNGHSVNGHGVNGSKVNGNGTVEGDGHLGNGVIKAAKGLATAS
jgi:methylenetetrahydrofolate reductase (NADPH)